MKNVTSWYCGVLLVEGRAGVRVGTACRRVSEYLGGGTFFEAGCFCALPPELLFKLAISSRVEGRSQQRWVQGASLEGPAL